MRNLLVALALGASVVTVAVGTGSVATAEGPNAIINNADCQANEILANDDGSSAQVTLPFSVNFFGSTYGSLWVNNNGNVTFTGPLSQYTPSPILSEATPIIAPFWADVDTRGAGSSTVHYGQVTGGVTEFGGHQAFCVDWINVGYYGSHADKLNSFQLLLIDRGDTGAGNFDIVFNYDKVQWETGDASGGSAGLGGNSARAGYSSGTTAFELPGSAVNGAFLDSNPTSGLIYNNVNSPLQAGRYVFPVRNGAATGHSISGHVWANAAGTPAGGAFLQACPHPVDTPCRNATSSADGSYVFVNLPDASSGGGAVDHTWDITVHPPSGSGLGTGTLLGIAVAGTDVTGQDVVLLGPTPLPGGTTITSPAFGTLTSGVPTVYWQDPLTLRTTGCASATTASATIHFADDGSSETVALTEGPPGNYTGTFPPVYPHHGQASITITLVCPGGSTAVSGFDLYIDPSGVVKDTGGHPIAGATVTLSRADDPGGPFITVPDGSPIMSPANQNNPSTTLVTGQFGWDVVAGYYVVTATADGCHAPGDAGTAGVSTPVLTIPPPVTDLVLTLECRTDTTPPVIAPHADVHVITHNALATSVVVSYTPPDVTDNVDATHPAQCTPAPGSSFAIGHTQVNCTATDAAGNPAIPTSFDVFVELVVTPADLAAYVTSLHLQTGLANDLGNKATDAGKKLAAGKRADACKKLDDFARSVIDEWGHQKSRLTLTQTKGLLATVYAAEMTARCLQPTSMLPAVQSGVADLIAAINGVSNNGLANDLRSTAADIGKSAATGGNACQPVALLQKKIMAAVPKKLTSAQAATLTAALNPVKTKLAC